MNKSLEMPDKAPPRAFGFETRGDFYPLPEELRQYRHPGSGHWFEYFLACIGETARRIRMADPAWVGMRDPFKSFIQSMKRRPKKGLRPTWMTYDAAIDQIDYATWFLTRWVRYLDKTTPVKVEPHSFVEPVQKPWVPVEVKPIENAEPPPKGGLFDVF
jgi:hypothetical protein